MNNKIPLHFEGAFDQLGGLRPTDDPEIFFVKARVFYKYSNRNGSYISDDYAIKLAESAYLKPVFGEYVKNQDFLGHEGPQNVKAYGFILPDTLEWVEHLDEDGETRNYATYDILLWAEYWEEAKSILNKTLSMEIDPKTVQGEWRTIDAGPFEEYVYSEGTMAGICILGDAKTPCFEGAAFFSMDDESYVKFTKAVAKYFMVNGGKNAMHVKFAGLEHENFESIFQAINPNFNEEGAYSINLIPCEIGEDYFLAFACDNSLKLQKYSYKKEEENKISYELVEETDYKAIAADFEAFKADAATKEGEFSELKNQYDTEKATLENSLNEMKSQFEALQNSFNDLQNKFNSQAEALMEKDNTISDYSKTIAQYEANEKDTLIAKFSCLPAEVLQGISERKDSLSIKDLNTELALEYTKFSMAKEQEQEIRIPQPQPEEPALYKILKNYKK